MRRSASTPRSTDPPDPAHTAMLRIGFSVAGVAICTDRSALTSASKLTRLNTQVLLDDRHDVRERERRVELDDAAHARALEARGRVVGKRDNGGGPLERFDEPGVSSIHAQSKLIRKKAPGAPTTC